MIYFSFGILFVFCLIICFIVLKNKGLFKLDNGQSGKVDIDDLKKIITYTKNESLLSLAEYSFYNVLIREIPEKTTVFCKVRLSDIFSAKGGRHAHSKISQKHCDFVICDKQTTKILLCLELDDKTHKKDDRIARDLEVDDIFKSASLTLIHIKCMPSYDQKIIRQILVDSDIGGLY